MKESQLQASNHTFFVPFFDDATGLQNSRFDFFQNEGPRLIFWRKFNCGWDKCSLKFVDENPKFSTAVIHALPLDDIELQDFDLRDLGHKIYTDELESQE